MKKIIVGILSFALLLTAQNVFAASIWNQASNDCKGINIANATTKEGYGSDPYCWSSSPVVSADAGDTLNVQIYYHNTGTQTANNTRVSLSAPIGSAGTSKSFSGSINSDQGGISLGSVSANISSSQTLTFNSVKWYTGNTSGRLTPLLNGQNGSEILSGGLNIGSIAPGWSTQGSLVVSFHVSNTTSPQLCQDPQANNYGGALPCTYTQKVCVINSFSANPTSITYGDSTTLSWNTSNCTSAYISSFGNANPSGSQSVSPTKTTTYLLSVYGSTGTSDAQAVTVTVNQPQKSCVINSFSASPTSITSGDSATLSWNTSDCVSASIYRIGSVNTTGTEDVYPTSTTTYTLTGYGSNGTPVTRTTTVTVQPVVQRSCVINSFSANPTQVEMGDSATLSWNTSDCISASISSIGSVNTTGTEDIYPTATKTYTLTAYGSNGVSVTRTTTVVLIEHINCKINVFSANPTSIVSGDSATLDWATSGCTSTSISRIGTVNSTGTEDVYPTTNTTYTLTAYNFSGVSVTRTATVTVQPVQSTCVINSFSASPVSITSNSSTTLNWSTSDCVNVTISNLGYNVPLSGIQLVYPTQTITYTLTATSSTGVTQTRTALVTVNQSASCAINSFSASPTSITSGDSATLDWDTSSCTNVTISSLNNIPASGSRIVYPTSTITYTLTARGSIGATKTRAVTIEVDPINSSCVINSFTADPSSVSSGNAVSLEWDTSGCTSATISGLSTISTSGSRIVYPTATKTYTLTAYGSNGTTRTRAVIVSVGGTSNNNCSIDSFTASDTSITEGDSTILRWNTSDCDHVRLSTFSGNVALDGSKTVSPSSDTTYVLTAYNTNGSTETDSIRIYVDDDNNNNNNNSDCYINSFTASDVYINSGNPVTLRWSTSDCDDVNISNIGSVPLNGSRIIYPSGTTTYVLRADGDSSESRSIQVNVDYTDYTPVTPIVTPIYNTNVVTTVATNVSQTGARLNGLITGSNYVSENTYFEYGTTINLGTRTASRATNGNTSFSEYVTGLSSKTIYFFQAVSQDYAGNISRGAIEVLQTLGYAGNVTTTKTVVNQGITVTSSQSPIMLKIENRYKSIGVGDIMDYVVTYKNIGNSKLTHPMIQVFIPKGITLVNSSEGTYSDADKTLSAPISDLNPNDGGVIYLQARVDSVDANLAQIVTTAILVYTTPSDTQENAMAYVLNNPKTVNLLGASAFFGNIFGFGLIGWLILLIIILLLILIARSFFNRNKMVTTTHKVVSKTE